MCIIVFLALAFGYWLPTSTKEEMKSGKKHFKILEQILAASIFITAILTSQTSAFFAVGVLLLAAVLLGFPRRIVPIYIIVVFLIMTRTPENSIIISSFGLLYGLPAGTLLKNSQNKKK